MIKMIQFGIQKNVGKVQPNGEILICEHIKFLLGSWKPTQQWTTDCPIGKGKWEGCFSISLSSLMSSSVH